MKNFTTLIKESFEVYKKKIKPILLLLLISVVGIAMLGVLIAATVLGTLMVEGSVVILLLASISLCLVFVFWLIFIGFSFLILVVKPVGTKLKEIFQEAWKKFWQYFWVVILSSFFLILSSLFLIIPGIIVGIYLSFYSYAFIIEGEKGMNALKRSWALVKGNWWKIFGRIILLNIVFGIVFAIVGLANDLLSTIFQFLSMPFGIIFSYLLYLELKKSKEIQVPTQTQVKA